MSLRRLKSDVSRLVSSIVSRENLILASSVSSSGVASSADDLISRLPWSRFIFTLGSFCLSLLRTLVIILG